MNDTKNVLAGRTIAQLNEIRKDLLLEVRDLRKRQSDCLDKVYQEVSKDQEDIAENYFSPNNESNGKYFSQRLDTCMRAVRAEIKKLEESAGAKLGEIEEELESAFSRLSSKEKELENLKTQFQGPPKSSREYSDILQRLMRSHPDPNSAHANDAKFERLLAWKRSYEEKFEAIVKNRTEQLRREIDESSDVQGGSYKIRNRKFENLCHAVNKAIDVQLQSQHQFMDSERDRLLKQYFLDQMALHKSYVNRYNAIKAMHQEEDSEKKRRGYHQNPLRLQQQQSIHSVQASYHIPTASSLTTTDDVSTSVSQAGGNRDSDSNALLPSIHDGKSWRLELIDSMEESLVRGADILTYLHDDHEQWLSSMAKPVDLPPLTIADLLAQQQLTLQSSPVPGSNRRASVSFFTDVDASVESSARLGSAHNATPPRTPGHQSQSADPEFSSPPMMSPSGTATVTAAPPEKLVSKHYEDIILKLSHVYQRYNDGRIDPLVPQAPPSISPEQPQQKNSGFVSLFGDTDGKKPTSNTRTDTGTVYTSPYRNARRKW